MQPTVSVGLLLVAATCWGTCQSRRGGDAAAVAQAVQGLEPAEVPGDLGERAYSHVERLVGYGPRDVGSQGWKNSLEYIADQLRELGLDPVRHRFTDPEEDLDFENISVTFPGESQDRIVIGAHHDTKRTHGHANPRRNFHFVGANDSGSGVGLLLEIARFMVDRKNRATIQLLFLDGEESLDWSWNEGVRAMFGSRHFVGQYKEGLVKGTETSRIKAFVLLDMVGAADLQIDEETNSTADLRDIIRAAAKACGHQSYFFQYSQPVKDDHLAFLDAGIPSVDLIDLYDNDQWHTEDDVLEHIAPESLQIVGEVVLTALQAIEGRYLPLQAPIRFRDDR
jgi:hypothetical protein